MRRPASSGEQKAFLDDLPNSVDDNPYADVETASKTRRHPGVQKPWGAWLLGWLGSRPRNLRRAFRRPRGHPIVAVIRYSIVALLVLLVGTPILSPSYTRPPPHYRDLAARCSHPMAEPGCANPFNEKIFISVSLYDKDGHLAAGNWGQRLLDLVHLIGKDNVFVSIYENDSKDDGQRALEWLGQQLPCRHKILYDPHVSVADFPTVRMPDGADRTKRLAYLSEMRNRPLRPLDMLDADTGVTAYDKVLFLNDVAFHPIEAAQLLFSTNAGVDGRSRYLATCGMDFAHPLLFYDLYAQRDAEGFSNGLPIFPFFSNAGQGTSRAAVLAQHDAVPVKACWGGIVAMQAKYLQNLNKTLPSPHFQDIGHHVINPAAPHKVAAPVRFRYEPEVFFDGCECCLLHADVSQVARNQGAKELGTYVNPYVRVAYDDRTLSWIPWVRRWERLLSLPQRIITPILRLPTHNPHRTVQEGESFMEEVWVGEGSQGHWEPVQREGRNGLFCGVREMQLIQQGMSSPSPSVSSLLTNSQPSAPTTSTGRTPRSLKDNPCTSPPEC